MLEFVARRLLHRPGHGRCRHPGVHRAPVERRAGSLDAPRRRLGRRAGRSAPRAINPQSTLLDADGSLWRLLHPNRLNGKHWIGSQPGQRFHDVIEQARYTLDARKRGELYLEATRIVHEDKPWLELFQEIVLYGVSKRVTLRPRADYRLLAAELTLAR